MADLQDLLAGLTKTGEEATDAEEAVEGDAVVDEASAVEDVGVNAEADAGEGDTPETLEEVVAVIDEERVVDSPLAAALSAAFTKSEPEPEPVAEAEAEAAVEAEEASEEESAPEADDDGDEEADAEAEAAAAIEAISPYDLPGAWFVIHSYSGYENKVKANLESRISSMHMEDRIFDVVIPMEDVIEFKGGRKVTVKKKVFPGYILARLYMDDDAWFVVRNTPGVTGFVGSGTKPTPLSRREVERILGVAKPEEGDKKKEPRFKPEWEVGETVRVVEGPFADFNGLIEDINIDQQKVRVLVDIFGRETPVELSFEQIQKY
ncbi:MAG: transcription termination/antitermination protein NusG [Acidimicrobiia bacterium]|nr:transcription termination/antitermination protein NusG [Acidimicrobiia bacterium]